MITLNLNGGEKQAFEFLNGLKLIKLAVSLGGTESLAQHPGTMTHAGVNPEDKLKMKILENTVRISIGVEDADDIIWDLKQALENIKTPKKELAYS